MTLSLYEKIPAKTGESATRKDSEAIVHDPLSALHADMAQSLDYLVDMLTQMRWMANRTGLPRLGDILLLAQEEAARQKAQLLNGSDSLGG